MCRDEGDRQQEGEDRERERHEEHRAPVEVLEQRARHEGPERGDAAAECRPERDRLRPGRAGPERRDQREGGGVGHPGGQPSGDARDEEHLVGGSEPGEQGGRDRQSHAEHDHQLAAVAITERAEPEHRRREAERVPHGDQVERRLRGVERLADIGQCDVRDRQIEVGDPRDDDQREEDELRPLGCLVAGLRRGRARAWCIAIHPVLPSVSHGPGAPCTRERRPPAALSRTRGRTGNPQAALVRLTTVL